MQAQQATARSVKKSAIAAGIEPKAVIDFGQQRMIRGAQLWRTKRGEGITGMSKTWVYEMIRAGQFPAPIRLSEYASAWTVESISAWLAACQLRAGAK